MQITKQVAKRINADAVVALAEVAKKYGLEVRAKGGSITDGIFVSRIEFAPPLNSTAAEKVTPDLLKCGLAPRGTQVIVMPKNEKGTILSTGRVKYIVEIGGERWRVPFSNCRPRI